MIVREKDGAFGETTPDQALVILARRNRSGNGIDVSGNATGVDVRKRRDGITVA